MSKAACVTFVTPFQPNIMEYLNYSPYLYRNCKADSLVFGSLLHVYGGDASEDLAEMLGVNIQDAATWHITADKERGFDLWFKPDFCMYIETFAEEFEVFMRLLKTPNTILLFDPNA